jgi:hypothetical protein
LGSSAGANLAAMLATSGQGDPTGDRVVASALWSCPCDLSVPFLAEHVAAYLQGAAGDSATVRAASPLDQVDPTDAPLFILNGTNEKVPVSEAQAMASAYEQAGIAHQLVIRPEALHGDKLGALEIPQTFAFLKQYVTGYPNAATGPPPSSSSAPSGTPTARPSRRHHRGEPAGGSSVLPWVLLIVGGVVAGAALVALLLRRGGRAPRP